MSAFSCYAVSWRNIATLAPTPQDVVRSPLTEQAETVGLGFALPPKIADVVRIVRKNEAKPEVENAA